MSEIREAFLMEDGRRAERHIIDDGNECDGTTVTEVYVEPKIEKKLSQRVKEHRRPCIYEREIETIDEYTGEVVDRIVESADERPLKVVERLVSSPEVISAQSYKQESDCERLRQDLREDIKDALNIALDSKKRDLGYASAQDHSSRGQISAMQAQVGERVGNKNGISFINLILLAAIAAEVAGLAWVLFAM